MGQPGSQSAREPTGRFLTSPRAAMWLNLLLPGLGLYLLGWRALGLFLCGLFLSAFAALLAVFLMGYAEYFRITVSGRLLEPDQLEQMSGVFHPQWLLGLLSFGLVVYLSSILVFYLVRRRGRVRDRFRAGTPCGIPR